MLIDGNNAQAAIAEEMPGEVARYGTATIKRAYGDWTTTHLAGWKKFGTDPRWTRMKNDPRYADNTSRNTARFLTPKPYSQI